MYNSFKKILKNIIHLIKNFANKILGYRSDFYIKRTSKNKKNAKNVIRVGFLVQMPELWSKQKPVYQAMVDDSDFVPYLIIVPSFNLLTNSINEYGNELNYYLNECSDDNYIIALENNKWKDLKNLSPI